MQGYYKELKALLKVINYRPGVDRLGFVGDLVNRGPASLDVLRFVMDLDDPLVVLGNHDFYCMMLGYDCVDYKGAHTLQHIVDAPNLSDILTWLRQQPLIRDCADGVLVHAGIPPQWSIDQAKQYSAEISAMLQGEHYREFLSQVFGDQPAKWQDSLVNMDRHRYIINALTRMRFCAKNGELDLKNKEAVMTDQPSFKPWFDWYTGSSNIYFGHWAALKGECNHPHVYALDAGCCWGGALKAIRVEDKAVFM